MPVTFATLPRQRVALRGLFGKLGVRARTGDDELRAAELGRGKGGARSAGRPCGLTDVPRYTLYLKPAAERALRRIVDRTARRRVGRAIDGLATAPRPPQEVRLQGSEGQLRIRTGDYRIIYTVEDAIRTLLVAAIGHRREVYRRTSS